MTTSTPPAWHFLSECDAPVTMEELSVHSHNLPVAATLREQNDSDQCANGEQNPPSALIPSDQCDECRSAPGQPHATGCEGTAPLTDSVSNVAPSHRIGTCYLDPDTGETVMPADFFGEKELRWMPDKSDNLYDGEPIGKVTEPARFAHEAPTNLPAGARSERTLDDNPLLNHMECTFNSCMDTAVMKNEGYAGSADPMANFNDSVRLGVPVPIGVAIRLSDKWARLCRLLQTGENPLSDESITDTIMDAVNYLAILLYSLDKSVHS